MKALRLVLACMALALGCAHLPDGPIDPEAERTFYDKTVRALTGRPGPDGRALAPEDVDYRRLRRAAQLVRVQLPAGEHIARFEAASAKGSADALARAHELLARDFTDVGAHLEKARHLHGRDDAAASYHEAIALALIESMLARGAGESAARPIRVYSRREQKAVLAFLDLVPTAHDGAAGREVIEARGPGGVRRTLWFEVSDSDQADRRYGPSVPASAAGATPPSAGPATPLKNPRQLSAPSAKVSAAPQRPE